MDQYLNELNTPQREAVIAKDGPSLIIAGAGSGKTRVLTYRIAHLLASGISPWGILALTFTNKAAREMQNRIAALVGPDPAAGLWMGTFHSIFSRILRYESEAIGFQSSFTIYDTTDSKSLIKSIIKELHLDEDDYKPGSVLARISMAKNNLITAEAYRGNLNAKEADRESNRPDIYKIYEIYSRRCKMSGAMDFDDLLLYTNILFRDNPKILNKYQDKFKYILVDEYQDTNYAQYLIIKKLSVLHNNITVVGDDAQSIYSFRGAKIENILNFKNDYPQHKLFKLEQNYRSTQTIVNAANSLIKKNERQIPKDIYSENDHGRPIKIIEAVTDNEEGYLVLTDMYEQMVNNRLKYNDFAILYRTNAQSRIFEEALRKRNMPYKIYGGLSFYQRKEVKDLISYFRVTINPNDSEAIKRVINYPARGIGATTIGKIEETAAYHDISIWQVITNPATYPAGLNKGTLAKTENFVNLIKSFIDEKDSNDAFDLANLIANRSGVIKDLHSGDTVEERARFENIEELLNSVRDFAAANYTNNNPAKLENFLENVALLTDQDNDKDGDKNKVTLMTIHSAKGLEFPYVYVVGMEEELFPSGKSVHTQTELEEERRLFYVALTRAEERVCLSYCKNRFKFGKTTEPKPSRFINEIDNQFVEKINTKFKNNFGNPTENNASQKTTNFIKPMRPGINLASRNKTTTNTNFVADNPENIKSGMQVEHMQFGIGRVIQIEGDANDRKALVFFPTFGEKKLILKFARLKIV